MTTAATLWVSAAVGVAAGAGVYVPVGITAVVVGVTLVAFRRTKSALGGRPGSRRVVRLDCERGYGTLGPVIRTSNSTSCRVARVALEDDDEKAVRPGIRRATIVVEGAEGRVDSAVRAVRRRPEVLAASIRGRTRGRDGPSQDLTEAAPLNVGVELEYLSRGTGPELVPVTIVGLPLLRSRLIERRDVYFDTDDLRLRRARCSLRLRHQTGRPTQLVWKAPAQRHGKAKRRVEREAVVDPGAIECDGLPAVLEASGLRTRLAATAPDPETRIELEAKPSGSWRRPTCSSTSTSATRSNGHGGAR